MLLRSHTGSSLTGHLLFALISGCLSVCVPAWAESTPCESDTDPQPECASEQPGPDEPRWIFFGGLVNAYPKMERERLIRQLFDPAMGFLAPGYDPVKTIGDYRDNGLLWSPIVGVGRLVGHRWVVFVQGGYNGGKVRTVADDRSIFLLPLHTDFEIKRTALYTGFGIDYYPWGRPVLREYDGFWTRVRAAKMRVGSRFMATYATYDAKVKIGLKPFPNLAIKSTDSWLIPSINPTIGIDIPKNERNAISIDASYGFFEDQKQDFNGWAFGVLWQHFF